MLRRRRLKNRPKLISTNTQRSVTKKSPDNPNRNLAVALLNVTSMNPVDPEPCSTSTQGKPYNTL